MILRQRLEHPVNGYWDGGAKQTFDWEIEFIHKDNRGYYCKVGSWAANHYFYVAQGKTDKLTLSYAKRHLRRSTRIPSTFEYIQES